MYDSFDMVNFVLGCLVSTAASAGLVWQERACGVEFELTKILAPPWLLSVFLSLIIMVLFYSSPVDDPRTMGDIAIRITDPIRLFINGFDDLMGFVGGILLLNWICNKVRVIYRN